MTAIAPTGIGNPPTTTGGGDLRLATLGALGIVFGDIGTSPLYTLKTTFDFLTSAPTPDRILGILSLVIWTLFLVTTVKYVVVAMSIDNDGEGGILALMSLLGGKDRHRPAIIIAGLLGAALIYGDGAITPAISVLSAVEGFGIAAPTMQHYILPVTVGILILLFAAQPLGTSRIGTAFGPIMLSWFASIGALGLWGVTQNLSVFRAVNPYYAFHLLATNGFNGFLVLGGIFLCVTGAEALYADMGHFGNARSVPRGHGSCFPALSSIMQARARLRCAARPSRTTCSFICARRRCWCHSSVLRHWPRSSPANRS
jgi:KUP system potassium uptake protein